MSLKPDPVNPRAGGAHRDNAVLTPYILIPEDLAQDPEDLAQFGELCP